MAANDRVVVNLATGLEDAERVTVAFLVAGAAVEQGKQVTMFLTKEAVRLGIPGYGDAVACEGCPPLARLFPAVRGRGRRAARLPDLLQRAEARRRRSGGEREARGCDPALAVDGRGFRDRLQLLEEEGRRDAGVADRPQAQGRRL